MSRSSKLGGSRSVSLERVSRVPTKPTYQISQKGVSCYISHPSSPAIFVGLNNGNIIPYKITFPTSTQGITLTGHKSRVNCLAISSDGRYLASGSNDRTIRIWDLIHTKKDTGVCLVASLKGSVGAITTVIWEPKTNKIAFGGKRGGVSIWDFTTGELMTTFNKTSGCIESMATSSTRTYPDYSLFVIGDGGGRVSIWDWKTCKPFAHPWTCHTDDMMVRSKGISIHSLVCNQDFIITNSYEGFQIWDWLGNRICSDPYDGLMRLTWNGLFLAGNYLICCADIDRKSKVFIYQIKTYGKELIPDRDEYMKDWKLRTLTISGYPNKLIALANSTTVIVSNFGVISVYCL